MGDNEYHRYDDRDRRGVSRFPGPQSHSERPVLTRDRFRSTQYGNCGYDDVEDDGNEGLEFDSFDDRVLQQPFPDRQQQAGQGRMRLSFPPGPSNFFSDAVPSQSQVSYQPREGEGYGGRAQHHGHLKQRVHGQLSRFAYNANPAREFSSDVQLVPSSSPALKAGQRRAEHTSSIIKSCSSAAQLLRHERQYVAEHESQLPARPYPQLDRSRPKHLQKDYAYDNLHPCQTVAGAVKHSDSARLQPNLINLPHAPPICQGIQLVPVSTLPDRLRTVFPYPTFNAVQSKCFDTVFRTDDNFVLSSPTGSGKTVILELAICRAIATNATGQYKVVYQAPTKALCSERQRDWQAKFTPMGLTCAELTGDSDAADVRNVQSANVIITTPEKWDSITRKWKDHEKLMRLVKVFLIDEVHILKEDRGAVLETVVSRMKSIGTNVRFVALSATVPNFQDVAAWLGKTSSELHKPAANEKFGEDFRPVKLQKHVCGYVSNVNNDFGFEKVLDGKLPEVIAKYSEGKPIMIFCATRASCVNTAKLIASWWISKAAKNRTWNPPTREIPLVNKDLRETISSGVAFHHAGLDLDDRMQVEKGFLSHDINVICCTSTLAVGVNLPCHLVIVKNTVTYTNEGLQEYSDLEMMQMLGRAGRPQFDDTAVAVIMTRQTKARRYETMVTGQDLLESKLHSNLIDHMNAEIGLGTIRDLVSARKWLTGTFLYVRLQQNPTHYKLEGAKSGQNIEEQVDDICFRDIALLREHNLVSGEEYFRCTEFGQAMARYYIHFETMKVFMGIQSKATPSEILSAIAQASEFSRLRFRAGEKSFYKLINRSPSIRFSIPVNLDLPAHKVSLIIQSVLGSADISFDGEMAKHRSQYTMETQIVFRNTNSLIRCIIDCQICLGDSVSIHSALMLERSLGSRIWDDSPLQMKQIDGIGVVGVRKFANAGIRCMEDLEACDAHRIEALVGRNPPFGMNVLETVKAFPKLRVSLHAISSTITKCPEGVKIQVKADIGFINDKPPQRFAGKLVYVCLLAETSDGRKTHFARISGQRIGNGQNLNFPALLTSPDQSINCYVMCDSIAGSSRGATIKPQIAPSMFPVTEPLEPDTPQRSNTSKRRIEPAKPMRKRSNNTDDFGDDEINDDELVRVACDDLGFEHIENFANPVDAILHKTSAKNKLSSKVNNQTRSINASADDINREPVQLANGKWACNHPCKDKNACKHLCCKEGMDKPPKKPATTKRPTSKKDNLQPEQIVSSQKPKVTQSKLQLTTSKRKISSAIEELDLTREEKKKKTDFNNHGPKDYQGLHQLQNIIQKENPPSSLHSIMHTKPTYCYSQGGEHNLSFMQQPSAWRSADSSDYGDIPLDELLPQHHHPESINKQDDFIRMSDGLYADEFMDYPATAPVASRESDTFGDDDSLLGDAMVGLADSQTLQALRDTRGDIMQPLEDALDKAYEAELHDDSFCTNLGHSVNDIDSCHMYKDANITSSVPIDRTPTQKPCILSNDSTVSSEERRRDFNTAKTMLKHEEMEELRQSKTSLPTSRHEPSDKMAIDNYEALDVLDMFNDTSIAEEKPIPDAYEGLEPWLLQEFGAIVEIVDE